MNFKFIEKELFNNDAKVVFARDIIPICEKYEADMLLGMYDSVNDIVIPLKGKEDELQDIEQQYIGYAALPQKDGTIMIYCLYA